MEVHKGEIALHHRGERRRKEHASAAQWRGSCKPASGKIEFEGRDINETRPDKIVRLGISMVPEGRQIFPNLSVKENLEVGGHTLKGRHARRAIFDMVLHTFPRLSREAPPARGHALRRGAADACPGQGAHGGPRLLLLDEPSMGLSPIITREIFSLVGRINKEKGISIVLVEQNAHMALDYSHRAYVLETGRVVMEGAVGRHQVRPGRSDCLSGRIERVNPHFASDRGLPVSACVS